MQVSSAVFPGDAVKAEDRRKLIADVPENSFIDEVIVWGTRQAKEMLNPF
ncbi:MAG: hypothetical protein JW720_04840 [Sedimentisphaerales bacterium]|nr:hypothetical protein [Sedimentisphaerales bacterium]